MIGSCWAGRQGRIVDATWVQPRAIPAGAAAASADVSKARIWLHFCNALFHPPDTLPAIAMHRLKERFRRLKRKPQHSDGDASLLDASTAQDGKNWTDASVLPKVVPKSASLAEQLWDRAYDELKADEAEATLVQAYERVLSLHLHDRALASDGDVDQENRIAQDDPGARRVQMKQLVTAGLAKIEREAKIKENVEKSVQVILQAKEIISSAISTIPQAALPWAGVCVALEVLLPTQAMRDCALADPLETS